MTSRIPILVFLGCLGPTAWFSGHSTHAQDPKKDGQLAKDLLPKLVTIKAPEISLSKALKMIQEQTGIEVQPPGDGDVTLKNISLDKVPFWQALDTIAKNEAADLRVYPYGKERKIALIRDPRGYREVPTAYSGPFRVVVKRVAQVRDLENDTQGGMLYLEVAWEPRFQAFYL